MEHILQYVSHFEILSLLDCFSRYNQILVSHVDQVKIILHAKLGKMPFGLINGGATFQRALDISLHGLINK